jgi:hypothetical protein
MTFQRATRTQKKLRLALHGPSGSGKTFTALELAAGLGDKVALIDTERGSASLYADRFGFDVLQLDFFSVDNYVQAIQEAAESGYDVLVIDSLSHAWAGVGGVLDSVNNTKGNTFTDGWGKVGTPQQNKLMDAILKAPLHIIVTLRVKTDYEVEKDERGKAVPKKVGLAPVQRDGVEYEFDIVGALSIDNTLTVEKSRMVDLAGRVIPKPDRRVGQHIVAWLNSGAPPQPRVNPDDAPVFRKILSEEMARIEAWRQKENGELHRERLYIIDSYKTIKGIATSIELQPVVAQHPATPSMSAKQILDAASALAKACDAALPAAPQAAPQPDQHQEQMELQAQ